MNTNLSERTATVPTTEELLSIIQNMQQQLNVQRAEFDQKVSNLDQEIARLRQGVPVEPANAVTKKTTTRRRMLRNLLTGTAGLATLGTVATLNIPVSKAAFGTLDYNGSGSSGVNLSTNVTTIGGSGNFPIFKFTNTGGPGSGTDPNALPIGVYSQTSNSFALYGSTTGSSTAPTAVLGVSGSNGILSDPFFANAVGGLLGTSNFNPGTIGLSQTTSGVEGRSLSSSGVKGITSSGVGGAFGSDSADPNMGAPLRIGLRNSTVAPTGSAIHDAGEISLDIAGRVFVCQAGNRTVGGAPAPAFTFTNPGFPQGVINPNGANWRFLTPMIVKGGPPPVPFTSTGFGDTDLHTQGELWVDSTTGAAYVNTRTGSTNSTMLTNSGLTNQLPLFNPVTGPNLKFAPLGTVIDTRPGSMVGGFTGPFNTPHTWNLSSITGGAIPSNAKAVYGIVTLFGSTPYVTPLINSFIFLYPTGNRTATVAATTVYPNLTATNFFATGLSSNTSFTIEPGDSQSLHALVAVVAYVA